MKWNPFENIGSQLKGWAIILYWIEFICEIIAALILFFVEDGDLAWIGFITIFGGIFFTTITNALMYGLGELIEKNEQNEYNTRAILEILEDYRDPSKIHKPAHNAKGVPESKTQPSVSNKTEKSKPHTKKKNDIKIPQMKKYSKYAISVPTDEEDIVSSYIDVICPECGEELSFVENTKTAECPYCSTVIKL